MGSVITLGIERFEIDWGKGSRVNDHSSLFLPTDFKDIPYFYADDVIEMKEGLSRRLGSVKNRLDLLGYSMCNLPNLYQDALACCPEYYPEITVTFEEFSSVLRSVNLDAILMDAEDCCEYDLGEFVSAYVFKDPEIKKHLPIGMDPEKDLGTFFENIDPYIVLRLLAENDKNLDRLVQWRYADYVDGGWAKKEDLLKPLPDHDKILLVTEGSTDSYIIERVLRELRPDIADFFHFIDMKEHYPFTGTGNLLRFCEGLASIKVQNKVLVLFDNDTAGTEGYEKCLKLNCPKNMVICKLPDNKYFNRFKTQGPSGISFENINGAAVAIECFLDLNKGGKDEGCIRWASYNESLDRYHGVLDQKNSYVNAFKRAKSISDGNYDSSRLEFLIDYLIEYWAIHTGKT